MGTPVDAGRCIVRIGKSTDHALEGDVTHLTREGVDGAGGNVVGANTDWVRERTGAETFGGMSICMVSLLRSMHKTLLLGSKGRTHIATAK